MYKKITHTIVEEHFDHPMASKIKKIMEDRKSSVPNDQIFNEAEFRNAVNSYMTSYANTINSLIENQSAPNDQLISTFESAFSTVDTLGNMTKPFITSELGEKINAAMRYLLVYLTMAVQMSKISADTGQMESRSSGVMNDLANALAFHNVRWVNGTTPETNAYLLLPTISTNMYKKLGYKLAGNADFNQTWTTKIQDEFTAFGNLFAQGLVDRYPERFGIQTFTSQQSMMYGCWPTPAPTPSPTPAPTMP